LQTLPIGANVWLKLVVHGSASRSQTIVAQTGDQVSALNTLPILMEKQDE
jgi:hypothetical protein